MKQWAVFIHETIVTRIVVENVGIGRWRLGQPVTKDVNACWCGIRYDSVDYLALKRGIPDPSSPCVILTSVVMRTSAVSSTNMGTGLFTIEDIKEWSILNKVAQNIMSTSNYIFSGIYLANITLFNMFRCSCSYSNHLHMSCKTYKFNLTLKHCTKDSVVTV